MSVDINEMAAHLDQRRQVEVKESYNARATHATTAFLLCFFLGFIGAHRFYLGQWRSGLAHLILFALGAAGLVGGYLSTAPLNAALYVVGGLLVLASLIWEVIDLGRIDNEIHQRNLLLAEGLIAGALLSDTSIVQEAERRLDEAVHAAAAQSQAAAPAGAATTAGMISLDDLAQARQMAEQSGRAAISYDAVSTFDASATPEERAGQQPVFAPPTTTTERRVNTQPLPIADDGAPVVETDTHTHSVDAYRVTDAQETDRVSGPSAAEALGLGAAALGAAGVGFGLAEAAHAQPEPLAPSAPEPATEAAPFAPAEPFAEPPTEPIPAAEPQAFTAFAPAPQAEPVTPPAFAAPTPEPVEAGADVTDAGAPAFMEPASDVAFASSYPSFVSLPEQAGQAAEPAAPPVAAEPATRPDIPLYFTPEETAPAAEPPAESYIPPVPEVYSASAPQPETYVPNWDAPTAPAEPVAPETESHPFAEAAGLGAVVGGGALAADAWAHHAAEPTPIEPQAAEPQAVEPAPMAEPPTQPMVEPAVPAAPKTKRIRVKHRIVVEGQVVREEIVEREIPADADMAAAARQIQMELEQNTATSPDEIARLANLSGDEQVEVRRRVEGLNE